MADQTRKAPVKNISWAISKSEMIRRTRSVEEPSQHVFLSQDFSPYLTLCLWFPPLSIVLFHRNNSLESKWLHFNWSYFSFLIFHFVDQIWSRVIKIYLAFRSELAHTSLYHWWWNAKIKIDGDWTFPNLGNHSLWFTEIEVGRS